MKTRLSVPIALAASAFLLVACSEDKPSDGSGSANANTSVEIEETPTRADETPSTESTIIESASEPTAVLKKVLDAYYDNDADTACELQTERYTKEAIASGIEEGYVDNGATCAEFVAVASQFAKAFGLDGSGAKYVELSNDGKSAKVRYTAENSDQVYVLVNTDGEWLLDEEVASE